MYITRNLIAERVTPVSGAETETTYVWGLDLPQSVQGAGGIGGLLMQATGTATRLYTYEANGNVGQLVDGTTGAVVAHYEYDPFGTTLTAGGTAAAANPFRFSTKYTDDETTLIYYGYRFYSPTLGRWLTRDPIGEEDVPNVYLFARNASVNYFDLHGLTSPTSNTCCTCGPDVTSPVIDVLIRISNTFDSWGPPAGSGEHQLGRKWVACTRLYGVQTDPHKIRVPLNILSKISKGNASGAWDISQLYLVEKSEASTPTNVWENEVIKDGVGEPGCKHTVAFGEKCFNGGYLNYLMWGLMCKKCHDTFQGTSIGWLWGLETAKQAAGLWKSSLSNAKSLVEVEAIVEAGYNNPTEIGVPRTTLHENCRVNEEAGRVQQTLDWKWLPYQIPK